MNKQVFIRLGVFFLCLIPFSLTLYGAAVGSLGPDPAERIMHVTGEWAARLLLLTLLISPLRKWSGWSVLLKLRRMLGLYAFFYGVVHLVSFAHFYLGWSPAILVEELVERPYITVGFAALLLMLPLAVTSTRAIQRRLGRRWLQLHRLIYVSSLLVCAHILWQVRSDAGDAILYIGLFTVLLAWRVKRYVHKRKPGLVADMVASVP